MASPLSRLGLIICTLLFISCQASDDDRKAYIVYMGDLPKDDVISSPSLLHTSMLQEAIDSSSSSEYLLHSYKKSFNGFVASLTGEEVKKLSNMEGIVSVFPNEKMQLFTTRSWDFIGFPQDVERTTTESDIIVGIIDSGIWPESASFNAKGFSPPPRKWKGTCQTSSNFTSCNNKIIGARYYHTGAEVEPNEYDSPRDSDGHGTHTASIVAGGLVSGASLLGFGSGTARGGVPSARIAVYKVCWSKGCYSADVLAAFDDAIADGVDIISVSLGGYSPNYFENPIAIGAFHALKNGILTSTAVGNYGHNRATITNLWPWSLSVAASTIDRKFVTKVQLGNNQVYEGVSINTFEMNDMYPIIYGGDAQNTTGGNSEYSSLCDKNSLNKSLVNGKIVLCDALNWGEEATTAGAVGMIMRDGALKDFSLSFSLPASYMDWSNGTELDQYLNSTRPTAKINRSVEVKDELAPFIVSFSSRGPNLITRDILKPDLSAPGVNILAAWSEASTVTGKEWDTRVVPYNIMSGTSMACPHASGAAAYIKSFHPTWSPSAIKSALMTTASPMRGEINTDLEFSYGSGQVDPVKAANPGLVYDAGETDYIKFLCGEGYGNAKLQLITGDNTSCSADTNGTVWALNYPSFAVSTKYKVSITRNFTRTVTNVGTPASTYKANVTVPPRLCVQVEPSILSFKSLGQKKTFSVTVRVPALDTAIISGSLVWNDGVYQVRSPIVAYLY
ncbi:hypothetical protein VitviT2T_019324 [Vitis vinifera]|uniref:Cucumisin n=1 Tax=Vitis vinifera TaxID=29760 RepID=A0ABY9D352_VITVI|eukprot:XP_019079452.1 PREDICTED: cucumisin isoform X1 [Vitis vinifera]